MLYMIMPNISSQIHKAHWRTQTARLRPTVEAARQATPLKELPKDRKCLGFFDALQALTANQVVNNLVCHREQVTTVLATPPALTRPVIHTIVIGYLLLFNRLRSA